MSTRTRSGPYTFADFLELVQEDQKADLLDGVIYMASPESLEHNELVRWLATVLGQFVEEHKLGRATVNKVAYRLTPRTAPEPDLAFVSAERSAQLRSGYVEGPPDLAVEFVSPDSVDRDYELKRRLYEQAGVREYWIIDAEERRAVFLVRAGEGFVETSPASGVLRSQAVPGFWVRVEWFWQRPLPRTMHVVRELLGKNP
jgi:Uma2 family endonuclease